MLYERIWLSCFLLILSLKKRVTLKNNSFRYCIIGAGPSGLQMGYFLKVRKRNYVIFEKQSLVGSFFNGFSELNFMTSLNKRYTGSRNSEYNLRFDWNSLLSDDENLRFTKYSSRYYPLFYEYFRYLNDFYKVNKLNVQFKTNIVDVRRDYYRTTLVDEGNTIYSCAKVIIATGLSLNRNLGSKNKKGNFHYCSERISLNKTKEFINKRVCIFYGTDTVFQLARYISQVSASTYIWSRSLGLRFAFNSHYLGDLRSINLHAADSYQLNSLDLIRTLPTNTYFRSLNDSNIGISFLNTIIIKEDIADEFVVCEVDMFDNELISYIHVDFEPFLPNRPYLDTSYCIPNDEYICIIGTASHSLDFQISNGGQINGFRHVIKYVHKTMEWILERVPWSSENYPLNIIFDFMLRRINEAAGLFRMPYVLGDVYVIDPSRTNFLLIDDFSTFNLHNLPKHTGVAAAGPFFLVRFEYGHLEIVSGYRFGFSSKSIKPDIHSANESQLIHPVVYFFERLPVADTELPLPTGVHHQLDDIYLQWTTLEFNFLPLKRFINFHLKISCQEENIYDFMTIC